MDKSSFINIAIVFLFASSGSAAFGNPPDSAQATVWTQVTQAKPSKIAQSAASIAAVSSSVAPEKTSSPKINFTPSTRMNSINPSAAIGSIGTRGGGDGSKIERDSVVELIAGDGLKKLEIQYLDGLNLSTISDPTVQKMFIDMLNHGLENNISQTHYVPAGPCLDGYDQKKWASTFIGQLLSPDTTDVCFDIDMIMQTEPSVATLVALALHEHAHHFGYLESDAYALSKVVGSELLLEQGQQGLDQMKASQGLLSQIPVGSEIIVKNEIRTFAQPVFQHGTVLDGNTGVGPGVYCLYYDQVLPKGDFKIIHVIDPMHHNPDPDSDGSLVSKARQTTTMLELDLDVDAPAPYTGKALMCQRNPDQGGQITIGEFQDAVIGSIELRLKN